MSLFSTTTHLNHQLRSLSRESTTITRTEQFVGTTLMKNSTTVDPDKHNQKGGQLRKYSKWDKTSY